MNEREGERKRRNMSRREEKGIRRGVNEREKRGGRVGGAGDRRRRSVSWETKANVGKSWPVSGSNDSDRLCWFKSSLTLHVSCI